MINLPHKIGTYRDGNQTIEFCRYCGEEGLELKLKINCQPTNFFADEALTPYVSGIRK